MRSGSALVRPGAMVIAAYIVAVAGLSASHAAVGIPSTGSITLTPDLFAQGKLWLLVTSGFFVAGAILPQLLTLSILAVSVTRRQGSRRFLGAAVAGHVGSTVVTYAAVGALLLAHVRLVNGLLNQSDYGISCVWAGALGAVIANDFLAAGRAGRIRLVVFSAAVMGTISAFSSGLALPEHILAFLFGAAVVLLPALRRAPRRVETWRLGPLFRTP